MTDAQLIEKFNPANGANISPEDQETMKSLTDDQIAILAKAFPNQPTRRSYILLWDKDMKPEKQLKQRSTWQNLHNLRKFSNKKNLVAFEFVSNTTRVNNLKVTKGVSAPPKRVVVDMTAQEAAAELTKSLEAKKSENITEGLTFSQKMAKAKADKIALRDKAKKEKEATQLVDNTDIKPDEDFGDATQ